MSRFLWMQSREATKERVAYTLDQCQRAGITDLALYCSTSSGLICNSTQFAINRRLDIDGMLPAEYLAREAEKAGVRVHAWLGFKPGFWTWQTWHGNYEPDWSIDGYDGKWLDFSNEEVQDTLASMVGDIMSNSPYLAGFNWDYARFGAGYQYYDESISSRATLEAARAIRAAMTENKIFSVACVPAYDREGSVGWKHDTSGCYQPWSYMLTAGVIDYALLMTYDRMDKYPQSMADHDAYRHPGVVVGITPQGWSDSRPAVPLSEWHQMLGVLVQHERSSFVIFDGLRMGDEYWDALAEVDWEPSDDAVPVNIVGGTLDVRIVP